MIAGCASLQNLTVDDVRNQQHFYKELSVSKGIGEHLLPLRQFTNLTRHGSARWAVADNA
jgi:hypothetical protein